MRSCTSLRNVLVPWLFGFASALAAVSAPAALLRNVPQTLTQPDGTVVHLLATGDEYYNRLHDGDGFTVVRDPETGYLVYAIKADGRLQPTAFVVGKTDPTAAGLAPGLKPDPWTLPDPEEIYPGSRRHGRIGALGVANAPAYSLINNVVIFIRFSDEAPAGFNSLDTYQGWFNSTTGTAASMQRYFLEASYNQLTVSSTFYPAASGNLIVSYQDSNPRAYYKPYNASTNPIGYQDDQRNAREWTLLQGAVEGVAAQIPSSLNVDTNNDGFVDSVVFVVSGTAVNADWSNLLWPHKWSIDDQDYPATINGKLVGDYDLQLDGNIEGSGVLCHEMTHTLGAPDLYHYSGLQEPVGPWDLMANDADPPQHTTAYLKTRYLGFIAGCPVITPPATVTLNPLTSATNNCARFASPNSATEYFMVEYRKRAGIFEISLPGSGLLVYRIDTAEDGQGNASGPPDELYIYRPDGTLTNNGTINLAPLNGGAIPPRTAINDTTNPSSFLSNGFPGGLSIHDVGTAGDTITFKVDAIAPCGQPGPFSLTSPADGANLATSTSTTLAWGASSGATSYDVYFGTSINPPLLGNQTGTSAGVTVAAGSTYFWRVVAKNSCSQVLAPASGTWAFNVGGSGNGITIFSDDFEGDLSKWDLGNTSGASSTSWGVVSCKTQSGNGAAWCAAGGSAPQPPCSQYAPNEGTFMIAGPFSLADAVDGAWDFDLWTDIDAGSDPGNPTDQVIWMWSLDDNNFSGSGVSGQIGGWQHVTANMSDMKMDDGTPIVGQGQVWFAFLFLSDATVQREGAYVDNVVIRKFVQGQPNFDHWIPAVIHKSGLNNSQWRSDVAVLNRSPQAATLTLKIHAPSGPAQAGPFLLPGNGQMLLKDVAGSLGITADSGAFEVVSDANVFLSGRTYNQVDATHTYGQDYNGAAPGDLLAAGQTAWLPQLTENALFRTNIGVTNTGTASANVTVTLYDSTGNPVGWTDTRDYDPAQFYQYQQPYLAGGGIDSGYAVVTVNSGAGVVAYASVIDQNTGDPTTINMKTGTAGATGPFAYWIPAVIHKSGLNNSQWRSDVAVLNRSSQAATLTLKIYAPSGLRTMTMPLAGNAQALLRDVAAQLGVTADSGALEVDSDQDVFLTGRTYNQVDATHTYGQDYDGQAPGNVLAAGQSAWLPQLTENTLFRTNIGVTNTGAATASVTVTLYDSTGNPVGWADTRDYEPGQFYQYQQPYLGAGGIDSGYAVVTVNSGAGVVAYASVIDQNTGDPTTISMKR